MKRILRGSLLGLLILGAAPVFAQPLDFRSAPALGDVSPAVSLGAPQPRPATTRPSPLDFQPATSLGGPIVRAKVQADPVVPDGGLRIEPIRTMPGKNGELTAPPASLPSVPTFIAPQPTLVAPGTAGTVVPGPVVGHPVPGPVVGHPVAGPLVGEVQPHAVDSGPWLGGGACGDSCGIGTCDACGCGLLGGCLGSWCGCEFPILSCILRCPDECGCCMYRPRAWFRAEYLYSTFSSPDVPPLLIANGPPANPNFTVLNSRVLFGRDQYDNTFSSGGRFTLGFWFPCHSCWGVDASAFWFGKRNGSYSNTTSASDGIATGRPIINARNGQVATELVAFPGTVSGTFNVNYYTELSGFDVNLRHKCLCGPGYFLDWFVGYRYLSLNEGIDIQEILVPAQAPSVTLTLSDSFRTTNTFNGGQIGLDGEVRLFRRWFLAGNAKVALGNMRQTVTIDGVSTRTGDALAGVFPGGLYASPTNIGSYSTNNFCVIPELTLKVGIDVTQRLRLFAGYNFLYVGNVMRATEQIDQTVNRTFLPFLNQGVVPAVVPQGPARPAVLLRTTDFVAHGLTAGLEYRW
jgi:hypothetical protein